MRTVVRRRGVRAGGLVALLVGLLAGLLGLAGDTEAALSGPRSLSDRVLEAHCVLIARLTKESEPKSFANGALYSLDVKEILEGPEGLRPTDLKDWRLSDVIPGASAIGRRVAVPADVDVLVFAKLSWRKRLTGINWCTNWVVPLRGTLEESTATPAGWKKMSPEEFLRHVRAHLKEMRDFAYLLKSFHSAEGSRQPYSWHDKPALLDRLLAVEDERVLPLAKELARTNTDDRLRGILDRYLAEHDKAAHRKRLRIRFDELLAEHAAGRLDGTEFYRFPNGSVNTKRPRVQRILDAAGPLRSAGDEAYVLEKLRALHRAGHGFVDTYLLRLGDAELFEELVRKARTWKGGLEEGAPDSDAMHALLRSRDPLAVLAILRIAFVQERAEATRAALEAIRSTALVGPGVRMGPGTVSRTSMDGKSVVELQEAWRAWWEKSSRAGKSRFERKLLDEVLGADPDWK